MSFLGADDSFYVGKCYSCRNSIGLDWSDAFIGCTAHAKQDEPAMVHLNWSCEKYEYDPGSLG